MLPSGKRPSASTSQERADADRSSSTKLVGALRDEGHRLSATVQIGNNSNNATIDTGATSSFVSEELIEEEINKQVDELLAKGCIEPSNSPHSAPIVMVKKKTGKWRLETADWLKAAMPKLKLWPGAKVELVADADMPKPQVYIGHFPKTEKYSNEDILQLLEGQNSALRTGDWRILNRVDRGKQIELTFAVDPNSDEKLKSVGHRLCYGFGQVIVRQRSKHSAEAKDAPTATAPVPAKTAQTPVLSQEVPSCSKSLTPTTRSGEVQSLEAASSTMAAPTANASVATTERPAHHRSPGCAHHYMVGSKQPWEEEGRSWPEQGLMAHSTLPSTHNNIRHLKCLQANLHHAKAASDVLCCRFATEDLSVAFLQEPWILSVSMSDHQHIRFDMGTAISDSPVIRNPRKTNWEHFTFELEQNVNYSNTPICNIEELEYEATDVHNNIENAFNKCCIQKNRKSRRDVPWWNKALEKRSSWNNPNLCIPSGAQVWYTDGSKLENGDTGAGVYGPRFRRGHTMEVIRNWEEKKLSMYWIDSDGQRQAKRFLIPARNQSKRMVGLRKSDLRILTGYLTGHCSLRYHLKKLNLSETETCRFCALEQETSEHVLCECPALCRRRLQILGDEEQQEEQHQEEQQQAGSNQVALPPSPEHQEASATRAGSGALLHPAGGHGRVGAGNAGRGGVPLAGSRVGGSTAATSKAAGPGTSKAAGPTAGAAAGAAASSKKSSAAASKGNEEDGEYAGAAPKRRVRFDAGIQRQVPMTPGRQIYLEAYAPPPPPPPSPASLPPPPPPAPPSRWQEMVGIVWPAEVAQGARRLLKGSRRRTHLVWCEGRRYQVKASQGLVRVFRDQQQQ
ncbi:hypothetical protein ACLKA6_005220 [Drosophila palustris]